MGRLLSRNNIATILSYYVVTSLFLLFLAMVMAMGQIEPTVENNPVLVALDLSEHSEPCLAHACEMAVKFGRPLILAHVVHENANNAGMYRRHQKTVDTTPIRDIAHAMLEERLARFRDSCHGLDKVCEIKLVVVDGVPETRLVELAARYDASMVVMSSHNRRGLSHWLYGSVTEYVVRNASCPVVVVGQGDGAFAPLTVHRPLAPQVAAIQGG